MSDQAQLSPPASRRDFLVTSASAAGALALSGGVHAAGNDVIRVGLVGCGGRGTGAAVQALSADANTKLVAMGDAFADRLQGSLNTLRRDPGVGPRVDVKPEMCFTGFDCYEHVIKNCDVILLASPPHFRPAQIEAAVAAGKHIFAEKPVAVDAPGVRRVLKACEEAKKKKLSVVSGLCWRYHRGMQATFSQIHEGVIGDIVALQCTYNARGLWHHDRKPGWSDMEWQVRNWLYFTWLSGDHIVEQAIHSLDKMAWAMKEETPVKAFGVGGRQARTDPKFGHIFDHHAVVFEYRNGVKMFHMCRQQDGTDPDVTDHVMGTKGVCDVMRHRITGATKWQHRGKGPDDMYQNEHDALFAAIRKGEPINNGEYMSKSSLLAILGRMVTYSGKTITWEQALNSNEDLSPAKYEWGPLPTPAVSVPGKVKLA